MRKIWIAMAAPLMFFGTAAYAGGDAEAGKAVFNDQGCADCHYEDDFAGIPKDEIKTMITEAAAGDHDPDLSVLSEEDIANVAAYFASFE
ncbi:c-type cytochrome [Lentisalinibacter salinarum]|uniref:c-type cytochrome n=1 Tax=Lentisalinibacter salinarum TaxID=2992239 RepID=UPI00386F661B